jgi:hypothetical protein
MRAETGIAGSMFEAARFRGNRKLYAIVMLRADLPHGHQRCRPCELRPGELEFRPSWFGVRDPLDLAG